VVRRLRTLRSFQTDSGSLFRPHLHRKASRGHVEEVSREQMDSGITPLAGPCVYDCCHHKWDRCSPRQIQQQTWAIGGVGTRAGVFDRCLLVRTAVCIEVAKRLTSEVKCVPSFVLVRQN